MVADRVASVGDATTERATAEKAATEKAGPRVHQQASTLGSIKNSSGGQYDQGVRRAQGLEEARHRQEGGTGCDQEEEEGAQVQAGVDSPPKGGPEEPRHDGHVCLRPDRLLQIDFFLLRCFRKLLNTEDKKWFWHNSWALDQSLSWH